MFEVAVCRVNLSEKVFLFVLNNVQRPAVLIDHPVVAAILARHVSSLRLAWTYHGEDVDKVKACLILFHEIAADICS